MSSSATSQASPAPISCPGSPGSSRRSRSCRARARRCATSARPSCSRTRRASASSRDRRRRRWQRPTAERACRSTASSQRYSFLHTTGEMRCLSLLPFRRPPGVGRSRRMVIVVGDRCRYRLGRVGDRDVRAGAWEPAQQPRRGDARIGAVWTHVTAAPVRARHRCADPGPAVSGVRHRAALQQEFLDDVADSERAPLRAGHRIDELLRACGGVRHRKVSDTGASSAKRS